MAINARSVSILVHGLPKAGKSTFASTSPKPMLYLDVEGGTRFLNLAKTEWNPMESPPPDCDGSWDTCVVVVKKFEQVKMAFEWLNSGQHCFESVAIDSFSELQTLLLDEITHRAKADWDDWGEIYRTIMGLMRDFHRLTMHQTRPMQSVVFVCPTKLFGDIQRPFAQGQSKEQIAYIPDVLAAMVKREVIDPETGATMKSHIFVTGFDPKYETGERVGGRIPALLPDATVPLVLDYIYGVQSLPQTSLPETEEGQGK